MQTSKEIIEQHTDQDGTDMAAVLEQMDENTGGKIDMTPNEAFQVIEAHVSWALTYLAGLLIKVGAEVGVIPATLDDDGNVVESAVDAAVVALKLAVQFDKARRVYDIQVGKAGPGLLVAQAVPRKDLLKG